MKIAFIPMALAVLSAMASPAHADELLTNGSFEAAVSLNSGGYCYFSACGWIPGWDNTNAAIIQADSSAWQAPSSLANFDASFGSQVAGLQNNSTLVETFSGGAGTYTLTWFDAGRNYLAGTTSQQYAIYLNETRVGSTYSVGQAQAWGSHSLTFTSAGGSQTLSFVGLTSGSGVDATAFLDNISLTGPLTSSIPEPSTAALLLAGMAVLVRRKSRHADE